MLNEEAFVFELEMLDPKDADHSEEKENNTANDSQTFRAGKK